jgi:hypothetical protein
MSSSTAKNNKNAAETAAYHLNPAEMIFED